VKLNLGAGKQQIPGYISIDMNERQADVVADLEEGLPFAECSIDVIHCGYTFEHINNFIPLMDECWRVLKDDGFMIATVPHFLNEAAVADPTHVRFFAAGTFKHFEDRWPMINFQRKPWIIEANVEGVFPLFGQRDGKNIFVLMRPDRSGQSLSEDRERGYHLWSRGQEGTS